MLSATLIHERHLRIFEVILADRGSEFNNFEGNGALILRPGLTRSAVVFTSASQRNRTKKHNARGIMNSSEGLPPKGRRTSML